MVFQSIRLSQWADPEETADPPVVKKQMQCCLQLQGQFGEPLQGQQIRTAFIGVTAMAEALQLFELRWTQTTRASCQVGLLQGLTSQAPAAFSPSDNPGRRVR